MKKLSSLSGFLMMVVIFISSCKSEDPLVPVPEEPKPTAVFAFEQVSEDDPFTFKFTNSSQNFKEVRWEFGDDSSSLEASPTHTFLRTGVFRVKLLSLNSQGYWAQKEEVIEIHADDIMEIGTTRKGDGTLDLSANADFAIESLAWYKGEGTAAELVHEGPVANISVEQGQFQPYTLRAKTPKGSEITISRLLTDIGVVTDITSQGNLIVSRDNGGPQGNEGSLKLVDNNPNSKFLLFDFADPVWFRLEYFEPRVAGAYTFTSANDAEGRDPKNWTIEGSNDGVNWTVLDRRTDEMFTARFQTRTFMFDNTVPYLHYRVHLTAVRSGGLFQLAEWRLLQLPQ
jgi:hypothetical protein